MAVNLTSQDERCRGATARRHHCAAPGRLGRDDRQTDWHRLQLRSKRLHGERQAGHVQPQGLDGDPLGRVGRPRRALRRLEMSFNGDEGDERDEQKEGLPAHEERDGEEREAARFWRGGCLNTNDTSFCAAALEEALLRFGKPRIFNTDQAPLSLPRLSPASSRRPASRFRWTDATALWTTFSSNGCGARSSMQRCI